MAKVIFTAWKNKSELLEVRDQFYPSASYDGPDNRPLACSIVEAWKLRGNVPHHVEATALLTDAILHDDAQNNSIFSIRATYSAAFCRFVTGLVDSKITGPRRTMFQRAVDLGLPASFVELRHEATHREPPSLVVLRKSTQRSLEWLWDNYWAGVECLGANASIDPKDGSSTKTLITRLLNEFLDSSESSEPQRKKRKRDQDASIATDVISVCDSSKDGSRLLLDIFLEESLLTGSERKLGESMNANFDKWDTFLQKITEAHPRFLTYLSEDLVHSLFVDATKVSPKNASTEALFLWLTHIMTSSAWEIYQPHCPRSYILSSCDENPNYWTKLLTDRLRKHGGVRRIKTSSRNSHETPAKKATRQNGDQAPSSSVDKTLAGFGWEPVQKWDSRALGVAATV
ncbi:hypothetical protein N7478_004916 [Penicillium angulare]|uniref:uncharacterized protein n=1 Tax=Penicillium angulare TaxID=116970 RepID=UPI002541082A|nr:uncharacterized protein N7478_004916 [Penicillium angulare]KAJ5279544.1 hypothetical protein N7478_004916 [Penicillium angulare]